MHRSYLCEVGCARAAGEHAPLCARVPWCGCAQEMMHCPRSTGGRRGIGMNDEREQTLNQLLTGKGGGVGPMVETHSSMSAWGP